MDFIDLEDVLLLISVLLKHVFEVSWSSTTVVLFFIGK